MGAANIKANKVTISSSLKINTRPLQDSRFSRDPSTSLHFPPLRSGNGLCRLSLLDRFGDRNHMKYRNLGSTGLQISEVIFGGGAVGGILIGADDDTRRKAVRMALDAGINWIDAAASYGTGASETAIGWLMKEVPESDRPYISTKTAFDQTAGDYAGQAERALTASLEKLQMDRVDLYQVHNRIAGSSDALEDAITPDDLLRAGGIADVMRSLVDKDLTRHIGFTSTGEAESLHKVISSQRFQSAQVYYKPVKSVGRA
ncbi:MAG TPA: aldo/keto reductase [Dehalococcoidia bacterium]|nr:aldo/keto reductase [Dehalococcoidia bacterium]